MEKVAVMDRYFSDITVDLVESEEERVKIDEKPMLW
jgi:hypothetical protein